MFLKTRGQTDKTALAPFSFPPLAVKIFVRISQLFVRHMIVDLRCLKSVYPPFCKQLIYVRCKIFLLFRFQSDKLRDNRRLLIFYSL